MSVFFSTLSRYIRLTQGSRCRNSPIRASTGRTRQRARLSLETLEDRAVPSASISVAGATINEIGSATPFITAGSGGLSAPVGVTLGPDGNVYVAGSGDNAVLRYNATNGQYLNTFVASGSGGLSDPYGITFGPDGNLYVASKATNQVLEYKGTTGAFLKTFVAAGSGGLSAPKGLTFGPDGNLYVCSNDSNAVLRFQGPSGPSPGSPFPAAGQSGATFIGSMVPASEGGGGPVTAIFGPDGNLYVSGGQNLGILRYNGTTGAFINTFVPAYDPADGNLDGGRGMVFDQDGRLYVSDASNAVHTYDSQGNFLGDLLVSSVATSVEVPYGITLDAQGALLVTSNANNTVMRYNSGVVVTLSAASSTPVSVSYATADGTALAGTNYFAQSGTVTFNPGQTSRDILLATQEDLQATGNVSFSVQLSNPTSGATIGTSTGVVTIVVDDTTRQFSIADTSAIEGDTTAQYQGVFVQGIPGSGFQDLTFGPDGNLYTTTGAGLGVNAITSYSGTTGALIGQFVPPGQIGLLHGMVFNNGYLYVGSQRNNEVIQFNATTGAFVDVFISGVSGGPNNLAFGPDANGDVNADLYVSTSNGVSRYNGTTGALLATYITNGSGGLSSAGAMTFDPTQTYLYVTSSTNQVLEYNARTGAYIGVAASAGVSSPTDVKFGPDGLLYVLSSGNNRILRYTATGTYIDDYVPAASGGMVNPYAMAFGPNGDLYVSAGGNGMSLAEYLADSQIFRFGTESEALFTITNSTPSTFPLTVNYTTADGTAIAGTNYTLTSGTLTFAPGNTTQTINVPTLDSGSQSTSLTFTVNLSNPLGGTISGSPGVGTILPSDTPATFYVVNAPTSANGGTNTTYKYLASGSPEAPYGLGLNDLQPRGVATTAAGTTEWVVDANKNVYVYSSSGTLLGSWSPGGLSSSAQIKGITTNGTDIWLVDSYADKVYRYAGAASLLSGSQNATSSFSLVSGRNGDTNPQDLVTDGTSIWVVDGSALKVFKYTLSGTALGSWSIDPADKYPTGITIDPTNVSNIWIVDNGTDKVYQYTAAASRTAGSQSAAAAFALAAGDTNPQGIADPPPASMLITTAPASLPALPLAQATGTVGQSPVLTAVNDAAFTGSSAVAAGASLASRDALFTLLARELLDSPGEPGINPTAGGAFTTSVGSPAPAVDRPLTLASVFGGQNLMDPLTPLTVGSSHKLRSEPSAVGLLDGDWIDE